MENMSIDRNINENKNALLVCKQGLVGSFKSHEAKNIRSIEIPVPKVEGRCNSTANYSEAMSIYCGFNRHYSRSL